jgi:hypothetical protein
MNEFSTQQITVFIEISEAAGKPRYIAVPQHTYGPMEAQGGEEL